MKYISLLVYGATIKKEGIQGGKWGFYIQGGCVLDKCFNIVRQHNDLCNYCYYNSKREALSAISNKYILYKKSEWHYKTKERKT